MNVKSTACAVSMLVAAESVLACHHCPPPPAVPEFGTIGAVFALAGIGFFVVKRRK